MNNQLDTDLLKKAEASTQLAKELITQAIQQSALNTMVSEEALKLAAREIAQAQTTVSMLLL